MERSEFNRRLRLEVDSLKQQYRDDNSAFLIWFLKNIYCLNELAAVDSVCDGSRDKGIDGLWVDEDSEEIYIFQSEFSPNNDRDSGDAKIREFIGVKNWFENEYKANELRSSLINLDLKNLLDNLKISEKISRGYEVFYVYVSNKNFDQNAKEYISTCSNLESYDNHDIFEKYTYISEAEIQNNPKNLKLKNNLAITYNEVEDTNSIVLVIPAKEFLKLDGIQDHTLFSRNVRLWTGKTRVNKGLYKTIENVEEHKKFFLYHNGVSIICKSFKFEPEIKNLYLEGYQVINGCQSIISFYQNSDKLSEDVLILTKITEIAPHNPLIQKITHNSNNQNSIKLKDLKSNDRVQIGLQNNFRDFFNNRILYKIKEGELTEGYEEVITMDFAAQLIMAFYFEEPHKTHLKNSFYGDIYENIFSKKMTCQRIYLVNLLFNTILTNLEKIENPQLRAYGLGRFAILRCLKSVLQSDELGVKLIEEPETYLVEGELIKLKSAFEKLFDLVVLDINNFISEYISENSNFDYKNLFKNKDFVDKMNLNVLTSHKKSVVRHSEDKFEEIYN